MPASQLVLEFAVDQKRLLSRDSFSTKHIREERGKEGLTVLVAKQQAVHWVQSEGAEEEPRDRRTPGCVQIGDIEESSLKHLFESDRKGKRQSS